MATMKPNQQELPNLVLDNPVVLKQYKEQSCVESGFKFIKNNAFELDSFYLKTPERKAAFVREQVLLKNKDSSYSITDPNISRNISTAISRKRDRYT